MLRASASSIKLTNLYGTQTGDKNHGSIPFANLIEIDGVRILLDCGWNDEFDVSFLNTLLPNLGSVHAVLFSTPELVSCGALPFVMEHIPPDTCVAAAGSTAKMGLHGVLHPFLYLFPNSNTWKLGNDLTFEMSVDKIYSTFRSVTEPYGGKITISHEDVEVECYPIFSGRMLGSHGWLIKYKIDELFYCPDFSLKPSYALKRFVPPTTATLLFIDGSPLHLTGNNGPKYEEQLNALIREILNTLRNGKDVLIPVSVAGRGLEILTIIIHLLTEKGGDNYKIVFASIQAAELLAKAGTMTEVLLDEIILSEEQLFANVVTCKTAEDVFSLIGPKICIADGETMDYGLSAELLEYFLHSDADGKENLIVLPGTPNPCTNAFTIATANKGDVMNLRYTFRSPLGKEELEEYYIQLELELEEQKKNLEGGAYEVASVEDISSDDDSDNNNNDNNNGGAGGEGKEETKKRQECRTGLVLPSYMSFTSKHLQFPILEATLSLNNAALKKIDVSYGLPVSDELQILMRRKAPARVYSDEGPEGIQMRNDAQAEANIPSKTVVNTTVVRKNARVFMSDLSGLADASIIRTLLKSRFSFAKKIVLIRGNDDDHRVLSQFCRAERVMKCGENVFHPSVKGICLELATQVCSYEVQLNSKLAGTLSSVLRRVRESRSNDSWEVGWVDGVLESSFAPSYPEEDERQATKRLREEGENSGIHDTRFTLVPLSNEKIKQCAEERERRGLERGSFYVGEVDLHKLRDVARNEMGLQGAFHKSAPMLVFDAGLCVRRSANGNISLSSMVSPSVFTFRRTVYGQFSQVL